MITYITAFIFYTLAMVGILLIGFVVYKKTMLNSKGENKGVIKVIDSLAIGPKKTLLLVKIRNEKFLIASGAEHTTFLAKLDENENPKKGQSEQKQTMKVQKQESEYASIPFFQNKNIDFDEISQAKNTQIQKQFMELYEKSDIEEKKTQPNLQNLNKKELLKQLLKNLDVEQEKVGSKF